MDTEFRDRLSQTNTRDKSIADHNWVMNLLTPEEIAQIKKQCISTRDKEIVKHWNPDTGRIGDLERWKGNVIRMDKNGAYIYAYDSVKLKDAIKNIIKQRYTLKRKLTPMEYFKSEQSPENDKYFEMLADKTIQTAYRTRPTVKRFYEIEISPYYNAVITEKQFDVCMAWLLVPDIEFEHTKERENR